MPTSPEGHWESVYRTKSPTELSWYQPEARLSVELIRRVAADFDAPIIDVGGGASTLVDGLLDAGYRALTVLDLAPKALALAQQRLGKRTGLVRWIAADVLTTPLPAGQYAVWHDRAVFHFLTDPRDRARYVAQTERAVRPGGARHGGDLWPRRAVAVQRPEGDAVFAGRDARRVWREFRTAE